MVRKKRKKITGYIDEKLYVQIHTIILHRMAETKELRGFLNEIIVEALTEWVNKPENHVTTNSPI